MEDEIDSIESASTSRPSQQRARLAEKNAIQPQFFFESRLRAIVARVGDRIPRASTASLARPPVEYAVFSGEITIFRLLVMKSSCNPLSITQRYTLAYVTISQMTWAFFRPKTEKNWRIA